MTSHCIGTISPLNPSTDNTHYNLDHYSINTSHPSNTDSIIGSDVASVIDFDTDTDSSSSSYSDSIIITDPTPDDLSELHEFIKLFPTYYTQGRVIIHDWGEEPQFDFLASWTNTCAEVCSEIHRRKKTPAWKKFCKQNESCKEMQTYYISIFRQEQCDLQTIQQRYANQYGRAYEQIRTKLESCANNTIQYFKHNFPTFLHNEMSSGAQELWQMRWNAQLNTIAHVSYHHPEIEEVSTNTERLIDEHVINSSFSVVTSEMCEFKDRTINAFVESYLYSISKHNI